MTMPNNKLNIMLIDFDIANQLIYSRVYVKKIKDIYLKGYTLVYVAPEIYKKLIQEETQINVFDLKGIDLYKSEIYSLGITILEMLHFFELDLLQFKIDFYLSTQERHQNLIDIIYNWMKGLDKEDDKTLIKIILLCLHYNPSLRIDESMLYCLLSNFKFLNPIIDDLYNSIYCNGTKFDETIVQIKNKYISLPNFSFYPKHFYLCINEFVNNPIISFNRDFIQGQNRLDEFLNLDLRKFNEIEIINSEKINFQKTGSISSLLKQRLYKYKFKEEFHPNSELIKRCFYLNEENGKKILLIRISMKTESFFEYSNGIYKYEFKNLEKFKEMRKFVFENYFYYSKYIEEIFNQALIRPNERKIHLFSISFNPIQNYICSEILYEDIGTKLDFELDLQIDNNKQFLIKFCKKLSMILILLNANNISNLNVINDINIFTTVSKLRKEENEFSIEVFDLNFSEFVLGSRQIIQYDVNTYHLNIPQLKIDINDNNKKINPWKCQEFSFGMLILKLLGVFKNETINEKSDNEEQTNLIIDKINKIIASFHMNEINPLIRKIIKILQMSISFDDKLQFDCVELYFLFLNINNFQLSPIDRFYELFCIKRRNTDEIKSILESNDNFIFSDKNISIDEFKRKFFISKLSRKLKYLVNYNCMNNMVQDYPIFQRNLSEFINHKSLERGSR